MTSNFLTDALGSPVAVTDNAGVVQTEYTYEPFGKTPIAGSSNSSSYQYTGRENDGTALYYYRARYYNPQLQRFISEDPIGFGGGDTNLFAYVSNMPMKFTDPSGLCFDLGNGDCVPTPPPGRKYQEPSKAHKPDFCKQCRDALKKQNTPEPPEYPCGNVWCGLKHSPGGDPIYPETHGDSLWDKIQKTISGIGQNMGN